MRKMPGRTQFQSNLRVSMVKNMCAWCICTKSEYESSHVHYNLSIYSSLRNHIINNKLVKNNMSFDQEIDEK